MKYYKAKRKGGRAMLKTDRELPVAERDVGNVKPLGKVGIARESCLRIRGRWPRQELLKAGGQELLAVKLRETSIGHHAVFMML